MTVSPSDDEATHGRDGALEAILEVAREREVINDFRIANAVFEAEDYEQLIAIAWRHQFSEDRSRFKRELRDLEQHVRPRILEKLEIFE